MIEPHRMESHRAPPRIDDHQRRVTDGICRAVARILDVVERRQDAQDRALCLRFCVRAACRRAGRCRG